MKHDVFISYAPEDKSIADAICAKLESARLKCWIATRDISEGEDRTESTRNAIASSRLIVLVLSENANAAPHLEREIAHAFYARLIIVPFRLGETLPRREFLFYLGSMPWFNALNPPEEQHLEALAIRIKGLLSGPAGTAKIIPSQSSAAAASYRPSESWFGALWASHYRTMSIVKWVTITTFLCAVLLFCWFAFHQTGEWATLAENRRHSVDRDFSVSSTPSPQDAEDATKPKQASAFTRFGLWQPQGGPTPLTQPESSETPSLKSPAERSETVALPEPEITPRGRDEGMASASVARSQHLSPAPHRAPAGHRPQFPGTQVREARKIDNLTSRLEEAEATLLAIQNQRAELQARLKQSEDRAQIAQKNAEIVAGELDTLRDQLKETEKRALAAQKNEELLAAQRDALQTRLQESQLEAQTAQNNAKLATSRGDSLQKELGEQKEKTQLAEMQADLATSQLAAIEAKLKKTEEEAAAKKVTEQRSNLAEFPDGGPDTQFQEVRQDLQPTKEVVLPPAEQTEFAQTQPPNPAQDAKRAPVTQSLDSPVEPPSPATN
jgi:hypothetical protein